MSTFVFFLLELRITQVGTNVLLTAWSDQILSTLSSWVLKTSKDRASTSPANVSQCRTVLARKFLLVSSPNLSRFDLCLLSLILSQRTTVKSAAVSSRSPPCMGGWLRGGPKPSPHRALQTPQSSWGNYSSLVISVLVC